MKKYTFLLMSVLLLLLSSNVEAQAVSTDIHDRSYSKTIQLGESDTFSPYINSGVPASSYWTSGYDASLINPNDIEIIAISTTSINGWGNYTCEYNNYRIIPKKSGTYTCRFYVQYVPEGYTKANAKNVYITVTVTVLEVKSISIPSTLTMNVGESQTFSPSITDFGASTTLTWTSSNPIVATIDESGKLSALGTGNTIITCTAHNGVSAQCEVTVNPVLVSSLALNKTETDLIVGEKLQLNATVSPDNATTKSVTWSSTNESVAVVSESGQVTAVSAGLCNITATAKDGSSVSLSCLVTVLGNVLYCEDLGAVPGATINLLVQLTNADAIQGFEFKLVLPEGVSVETDAEGRLKATLTDRATTQGLEGVKQSSNIYQFVFTSTNRLLGTSGAVVNIPLVVANNTAVGNYDVVIKDVELVKYGTSAQIHHGDRMAMLNIKEMTLGDVNGDGRVSVADAISIINYVLGRTPVSFITQAADVNGDSSISLGDAVATVDIILGGSSSSRTIDIPAKLDPQ